MKSRFATQTILSAAALTAVGAAFIGAASAPAVATSGLRSAFAARYPSSTLLVRTQAAVGSQCYACHQPPNTSEQGNCYKDALTARLEAGRTNAQAIADVELLDSDGDGISNLDEIMAARADMPDQIGYNPGLIGDTGTDPCATDPTTPVTGQPETPPPVGCTADFNNDGGVDGADVEAFFAAWEVAEPSADVNEDGGVDGGDVEYFFQRWEAGC